MHVGAVTSLLFACVLCRFEDGSFSEYAKAPYPLVPAAWVTSDALHKFYSIPDGMSGDVPGNSQVCAPAHSMCKALLRLCLLAPYTPTPWAVTAGCHRVRRPVSECPVALAVAAACVPQPALTACTRCRLRRFYSVSDLATFSQLNGVPQPDVTVVGSNNIALCL